jgi:FKBP-type peptidyl-prolyl cis-trans isomerase
MFRSSCVAIVLAATLSVAQTNVLSAQENQAAGQQGTAGAQLTPKVVVQEPADEGSLVDKVSYFMGFNLMSSLKRQGNDVNMGQLFEGMKAAVEGPDRKDFVAGYQLMSNLKEQGADLKLEKMLEGMTSASDGNDLGMSPEEVNALMQAYTKVVERKQVEKMKQESDVNLAAGEAYMAKVAAENPNAKMLEGGIQYQILKEGTGPMPTVQQKVKVDYHGTFIDGTVFDSTLKPLDGSAPTPAEFNVAEVVPGFSRTLQTMKVGSTWKICIPGPQAYGASGRGKIGPNQALIFEITLLDILN